MTSTNEQIDVLGGGFVRLDDYMANDLSVVNSARVSFGKRIDEMTEADEKLINFLMREKHGTPFEHNSLRFHVKAPIFVAREWFRHRIGWSYNEFSARYTKMESEAYVPDESDFRTQVGSPGRYVFESLDLELAVDAQEVITQSYRNAYGAYSLLLEIGVAKEMARMVLPVGMFTEFYATCNARSLMHFMALRGHATAQKEIRSYSDALECHFSAIMPVTYESWCRNGKVAP